MYKTTFVIDWATIVWLITPSSNKNFKNGPLTYQHVMSNAQVCDYFVDMCMKIILDVFTIYNDVKITY